MTKQAAAKLPSQQKPTLSSPQLDTPPTAIVNLTFTQPGQDPDKSPATWAIDNDVTQSASSSQTVTYNLALGTNTQGWEFVHAEFVTSNSTTSWASIYKSKGSTATLTFSWGTIQILSFTSTQLQITATNTSGGVVNLCVLIFVGHNTNSSFNFFSSPDPQIVLPAKSN